MRSTIVSSLLLASLAAASVARAEPTPSERTAAEALFREGKKLLAKGKIAEACEKLASSYKIDPAGGTLLNLAACHEAEGKTATAWGEFTDALAMAKKAKRQDRQKEASAHLAALEGKLSRVTLTAPSSGAIAGLEAKLDGVVLAAGALGTGIPVDPGEHVVGATAPGKVPWERRLTIAASESKTIPIPELEVVPEPEPPPPPPSYTWQKAVGGVGVGLGGVALVVGAAFGVRAVVKGGQVAGECHDGLCSAAGLDAVASGRTSANVANAMLPVGAALAAGGITLLALYAGSPAKPATGAAAPGPLAGLRVTPLVGPGSAALTVGGVF